MENQTETFSGVYKMLTGKDVNVEFEFLLQTKMTKNIYIHTHTYTKICNGSDQM